FIILMGTAITSFWWGALETLRASVRHAFKAKDQKSIDQTLGYYLMFAIIIISTLMLIAIGTWYNQLYSSGIPIIMQWFTLFYIFKVLINLMLRTYHSGAYAITRIVRTPLSVIAPELIGIMTLAVMYPLYPEASALGAMIVRNIVGMILVFKFTNRMYNFYELEPVRHKFKIFFIWIKNFPVLEFLLAGTSFLLIQADIVLIMLATYLMQSSLIPNELFLILFLISPMFTASTSWAFLFYFDRKRVNDPDLSKMMAFYNTVIQKYAIFFAILYWLIALFVSVLLLSSQAYWYLIALLPFFIIKSILGNFQIKSFSERAYIDIILASLFVVLPIAYTYYSHQTLILNYLLCLVGMACATTLLKKPRFKTTEKQKFYKLPINIYKFMNKLVHQLEGDKTIYVYLLTLSEQTHVHQRYMILDRISEKHIQELDEICIIDDDHFIMYSVEKNLSRHQLIQASSGLMLNIDKFTLSSKDDMKEQFMSKKIKDVLFHDVDLKASVNSTQDIHKIFFENFPKGIFYTPEPILGPEATSMEIDDIRALTVQIRQYLFHVRKPYYSEYEVTLLYQNNRIEYIFAIKIKDYKGSTRRKWQDYIREQNILYAITSDKT
ncbi:hypothetical protein N8865_02475, partial [Francisellaceae bacterium]|nr:hypothetical protein [Francisellaceae bacterium]